MLLANTQTLKKEAKYSIDSNTWTGAVTVSSSTILSMVRNSIRSKLYTLLFLKPNLNYLWLTRLSVTSLMCGNKQILILT